jgi:hypothetical protein
MSKQSEDFSTNYSLNACKVCDEKASGLHYGVITCEGCKV